MLDLGAIMTQKKFFLTRYSPKPSKLKLKQENIDLHVFQRHTTLTKISIQLSIKF